MTMHVRDQGGELELRESQGRTCRKAKAWSTVRSRSGTLRDMTWLSMATAMHSSVSGSRRVCLYVWKYSFSAAA